MTFKLRNQNIANVPIPAAGTTSIFVDDADKSLKYVDSTGTITSLGVNQEVDGMEITTWVKSTFVEGSADNIMTIFLASKINIDTQQEIVITRPATYSPTSGKNVITSLNDRLARTALPIRVKDIVPFNKVTQKDGVWTCNDLLRIDLRHVEIKDL